jgi:hypothetical protein
MFRHTRSLLRRYQERGLLPGRIAEREPFHPKYEGERKGLGFVMTV